MFGKDHDVVGSKDRDLILQTNGKIKIQFGKKFIDLLDLKGNLNVKTKEPINSVKSPEEVSKSGQGFYILDGNLFVNVDGEIIQLTGLENIYVKYKEAQKLNQSEIDIVQKNIGFKFSTIEEAKRYITKGIINIDGDLYYLKDEEEPKKLNIDLNEPLSAINEIGLGVPTGDCFIAYIDGRWCYCPLKGYGSSYVTSFASEEGNVYTIVSDSTTNNNEGNTTTRGITPEQSEDSVVVNYDLPVDFAPLWYSKQYYIKNAEFFEESNSLYIKNLVTVPFFDQFPDDKGFINIQLIRVNLAGVFEQSISDDSLDNPVNVSLDNLPPPPPPPPPIPVFKYYRDQYGNSDSKFTSYSFTVESESNKKRLKLDNTFKIYKGIYFEDDYNIILDNKTYNSEDHLNGSKYILNVHKGIENAGTHINYIVDTNNNTFYILGQTVKNPLSGSSLFIKIDNNPKLRRGMNAKLAIEENFTKHKVITQRDFMVPMVYMGNLGDTSEYYDYYKDNSEYPDDPPQFNTYQDKYIVGLREENTPIAYRTNYGLYSKQAVFNGVEIRGKWPKEEGFDFSDFPRYSQNLSDYLSGNNVQINQSSLEKIIPDIKWIRSKFLNDALKSINNEPSLNAPTQTQDGIVIAWKDGQWKYVPINGSGTTNNSELDVIKDKVIPSLINKNKYAVQMYPVQTYVDNGQTIINTLIPQGLALCNGKNGTTAINPLITTTNNVSLAYVQQVDQTYVYLRSEITANELNTNYLFNISLFDYVKVNDEYQLPKTTYNFTTAQTYYMYFYHKRDYATNGTSPYIWSGSFEGIPADYISINNKVTNISPAAFKNTNASIIDLPDSVEQISSEALCTGNSNLVLRIKALTPPTLLTLTPNDFPIPSDIASIRVPSSVVSVYQNASGWSTFVNKISSL